MSGSKESVFQAALAMSPDERAALAEQLLNSLNEDEKKLDELWAAEAERRLAAYRQGRIKAIPANEVFSKLLPETRS